MWERATARQRSREIVVDTPVGLVNERRAIDARTDSPEVHKLASQQDVQILERLDRNVHPHGFRIGIIAILGWSIIRIAGMTPRKKRRAYLHTIRDRHVDHALSLDGVVVPVHD